MAGLVVQHNLNAINANNKLTTNVIGVKKATEKLSSGFAINRAGDNAAGLAISEKMRSQIRGLGQAIKNANDGISLIQTAEGGLNETHAILQRMRELAVQSANGTYHDELDREAIQLEVDRLKDEVDRIASSTEYNKIKLLDGSLGGASSANGIYGPRFAILIDGLGGGTDDGTGAEVTQLAGTVVTSSINSVTVGFTVNASGRGGENASWNATGTGLTINLSQGVAYTQAQIDDLIKNAKWEGEGLQVGAKPEVTIKLGTGVFVGQVANIDATVQGIRAESQAGDLGVFLVNDNTTEGYADRITFVSNNYGVDTRQFAIATSVAPGKEWVEVKNAETDPNTKDGMFVLHLSTGKEYTAQDIETILRRAGFDYEIRLTNDDGSNGPNGFLTFFANNKVLAPDLDDPDNPTVFQANAAGDPFFFVSMGDAAGKVGQGVGRDQAGGTGQGLVFQIGANGVADQRVALSVDDMSAAALGIANVNVSDRDSANEAIEIVDKAVSKVSFQRAALGALQNRLEHTVNNLTVTQENLTAAESQIRDTDMAKEMIEYTKFSILQQAAQAMLAQANQAPQAILQLLG